MSLPRTKIFRERNAIGDWCPYLEMHRSQNDMPDMVISTKGNSKVFAHRLILGSRFCNLFRRVSGPITRRNTKVNWSAFEHGIIETLVRFAYTGEIVVTLETAYQLFLCAWNVGSEFVSSCISQFLVKRINLDNINLIWAMANITHCVMTKIGCIDFISANLEQIMFTNLLNRLDVRTLSSVLTHKNKTVFSEEVVIHSITNWTKYMEHSKTKLCRIDHFSKLCRLVDWTKVPVCFIANLLVKEQYLASYEVVREELAKAIKANALPIQTSKTLYAIGWVRGAELAPVVKFESDKPAESTLVGHVEACNLSRTVLLKGVLFVIGGVETGFSNRVSTFNLTTGEKSQVADLGIGRLGGHAVAASSEEIFVCGGSDESHYDLSACEAFRPGSSGWRRLPDMNLDRNYLAVTYLPDGRLLATGGLTNIDFLFDEGAYYDSRNTCEMLNTASESEGWRPVAEMLEARCFHSCVYFEGRIFMVGGYHTESCEVFAPPPIDDATQLGQWTRMPFEMTRRFAFIDSIVAVSANEILVFGEVDTTGEIERFKKDPASISEIGDFEAWSCMQWPQIGNLLKGRAIGVHLAN